MNIVSNNSERGSEVPTPIATSCTMACSPRITTVDGDTITTTTPRPILGSIAKPENRIIVVKDEAIWSHSSSHLGSSRCKYFMVSEW
ncbi:hypothetical protein HBI56_225250 [Parastagonospora nodorum]|nr:hypothetical protein HBH56_238870 [Parastagonospora nodorum]KAH3921621.1 hypothetical protein HBH54_237160 [Parastagonospora nodorum]KAH3939770.1 hypothetical protein HBH53_229080 [Parastagonospora nodorum]KAH3957953.1 hypothetical protein HBH51_217630 [Parastagonospora nodorum]KAH3967431.1 hypothetical protein HBH52_186860 [Parastagonospora nodorum]